VNIIAPERLQYRDDSTWSSAADPDGMCSGFRPPRQRREIDRSSPLPPSPTARRHQNKPRSVFTIGDQPINTQRTA
jgi:hypothetical protein